MHITTFRLERRFDLWQVQESVLRIGARAQQASYTVGAEGPFPCVKTAGA
jgi:hypothetical protein